MVEISKSSEVSENVDALFLNLGSCGFFNLFHDNQIELSMFIHSISMNILCVYKQSIFISIFKCIFYIEYMLYVLKLDPCKKHV